MVWWQHKEMRAERHDFGGGGSQGSLAEAVKGVGHEGAGGWN